MIGRRFGRLIVVEKVSFDSNRRARWRCNCDCGKETVAVGAYLRNGHKKSCGCLRKKAHTTHGLSKHPLFTVWQGMRKRCTYLPHKDYHRYGGRGIKVCDEWMNDFVPFYNWAILHRWERGLQIDRINNDGDYTPLNCRIVTPAINTRNSRVPKINKTTADMIRNYYNADDRLTVRDTATHFAVSYDTVYDIVKRGYWR
jgi:hypothetical protein